MSLTFDMDDDLLPEYDFTQMTVVAKGQRCETSSQKPMRQEYDFSNGKRGAIIPSQGKTRITIYLDNEILDRFREQAEAAGVGYQTLINQVLKEHIQGDSETPLTEGNLRRIFREELLAISAIADL
jgi:uncharacterized protein (DUF4415 family)